MVRSQPKRAAWVSVFDKHRTGFSCKLIWALHQGLTNFGDKHSSHRSGKASPLDRQPDTLFWILVPQGDTQFHFSDFSFL